MFNISFNLDQIEKFNSLGRFELSLPLAIQVKEEFIKRGIYSPEFDCIDQVIEECQGFKKL